MKMQKFEIDKDYKSVYHYLKTFGISERFITFLRKEMGRVKQNGVSVTVKQPLKKGDLLEITMDDDTKSCVMQCILPIDIVYEDEYYLIVNKPSGLACIPTKSHYNENLSGAVAYYLQSENFAMRVLNRLDIDTAGLVIFAKNLLAANMLKSVDKTYYALCEGCINAPICINKPIETINENGINQRKRVISDNGKDATTFVEPVQTFENYTLVKLKLVHGRTHQIRVHMSSIGHPLLGDTLYGKADTRISHTALVCKALNFYHAILKKEINLEVDFPEDFKKLLSQN